MLLRKLPALLLFCCLLAGEALAVGGNRCSCCAVRPCCSGMPAMPGHAACAMHRTGPGASCAVQAADREAAVLHVHRGVESRPAVFPRLSVAPPSQLASRLPEPAAGLPASPTARPETPPPRLLTA